MKITSGPIISRRPGLAAAKGGKRSQAASIPAVVSRPRSGISSVNRIFKALEKAGVGDNPIPMSLQKTVSALGGLFAGYNIAGELAQGDFIGALEDTADGAVSLHGGLKLLTHSTKFLCGFGIAGVVLNAAFAAKHFADGKLEEGAVHGAVGIGLALTISGALPAQVAGLVILGGTGLYRLGDAILGDLKKGSA